MQPDETGAAAFSSQTSLKSVSTQDLNEPLRQQEIQILNELKELNYFAFSSSSSLTLYSFCLWKSEQKILVATKENNIKEFYFEKLNDNNGELEPKTKINKLPLIDMPTTASWISSIDIFDVDNFSVLTVAFVSVSIKIRELYIELINYDDY